MTRERLTERKNAAFTENVQIKVESKMYTGIFTDDEYKYITQLEATQ